jgi:glutaredoxin
LKNNALNNALNNAIVVVKITRLGSSKIMKFSPISFIIAANTLAISSLTGIAALTFAPQVTEIAIAQEAAPRVTSASSRGAIGLAQHLRKTGAKLYTAFWCPHCHTQKQRFGKEAVNQLEVIECDQRGVKPQTQLCQSKRVRAFPSWEINDRIYAGSRSLETLAELSGYRGKL